MSDVDFPTDLDSWASQVSLLEDRFTVARGDPGLELDLASARMGLGRALLEAGELDRALATCERARATFAAWVAAGHRDLEQSLLTCELDMAAAARALGRAEEALASFERARALIERWPADGESDREINLALCDLHAGQSLAKLGRNDEAIAALSRARPVFERRVEADDGASQIDLASLCATLGSLHLVAGRLAEARTACQRGAELLEPLAREPGGDVFEGILLTTWLDQARALVGLGAFADADNVLGWAAELLPHHRRLARVGGELYHDMIRAHDDRERDTFDLSRGEVVEGADDLLAAVTETQGGIWQADLWRGRHAARIAGDVDRAAAELEAAGRRHRAAEPRLGLALAELLEERGRHGEAVAAARQGAVAARSLLEPEGPDRALLAEVLLALVELAWASIRADDVSPPTTRRDEGRRELVDWLAPLEEASAATFPDAIAARSRELAAALREDRAPSPIASAERPWWGPLLDRT